MMRDSAMRSWVTDCSDTGLPKVTCLKYLRSLGRYQGSLLLRPMTRLLALATIRESRMDMKKLYSLTPDV